MKRVIAFLCLAEALFGQLVVVAPDVTTSVISSNSAQLAQWAAAIAKYEQQIEHQMEQIEKAKKLLDTQNTLLARVGDWQQVAGRARSLQLRAENLTADFGLKWKQMALVDSGDNTLAYTADGLFDAVSAVSDQGVRVVNEKRLRRYKVIENMYEDMNAMFDQTDEIRRRILDEIASTSADIAKAKNQAEADILRTKLEALKAALANVQSQRDEKMQRLLVQQALHSSQKEKEELLKEARDTVNSAEQLKAIGSVQTGGAGFR